jgi:hypothetical protein
MAGSRGSDSRPPGSWRPHGDTRIECRNRQPTDSVAGIGIGIDTTVPQSARIWNYWLGGKDNYAVDREAGDAWMAVHPQIKVNARESRAFLQRVVRSDDVQTDHLIIRACCNGSPLMCRSTCQRYAADTFSTCGYRRKPGWTDAGGVSPSGS